MKNNLLRACIVASAFVLVTALVLPGGAAATPDDEPGSTTETTASCVTVYPDRPDVVVDPQGCKDLIPTNRTAIP